MTALRDIFLVLSLFLYSIVKSLWKNVFNFQKNNEVNYSLRNSNFVYSVGLEASNLCSVWKV